MREVNEPVSRQPATKWTHRRFEVSKGIGQREQKGRSAVAMPVITIVVVAAREAIAAAVAVLEVVVVAVSGVVVVDAKESMG